MKLRMACERDRYEAHKWTKQHDCSTAAYCEEVHTCPGGVFLPDDTLTVIIDALRFYGTIDAFAVLNALSVREADLKGDLYGRD